MDEHVPRIFEESDQSFHSFVVTRFLSNHHFIENDNINAWIKPPYSPDLTFREPLLILEMFQSDMNCASVDRGSCQLSQKKARFRSS
ncbi:hypothetical protein NPIL_339821 [Nephila pilipes]|uniref:Uncharacterized protein n=1 Tax=Nephila pilipes TaxID=299642 RepID=A0A8X6K5A9_NEPPI|nr:hypothetical protein NPIL_339821 [Nephila pilipes]